MWSNTRKLILRCLVAIVAASSLSTTAPAAAAGPRPVLGVHHGYYDAGRVRVRVKPSDTQVFVDGYYAGVSDDFDGLFQRLHVPRGPHEITLALDGYRTRSFEVFVSPGHTVKLRHQMVPAYRQQAWREQPMRR